MKRIVILGAGTGGTLVANRLRRHLRTDEASIVCVDRNDRHVYQPGMLFVPFGLARATRLVRPRGRQLRPGVELRHAEIDRVDLAARAVHLEGGELLNYDVLIVASGATLAPEETEGLTGPGWGEKVFTFYDLGGASALEGALATFERGRLVVNVVDMPIKCPVAPLEFCFLADWYLRRRGVRERVTLTFVTPLDGAFTRPIASKRLGGMLAARGIELVTEFNTASVDGVAGELRSYDDRVVPFDLAVVVPVHSGSAYVTRSEGLGDALGFVPTDAHTLQSKAAPEVFVLGDATDVATSKAGSVAHFEGEVLEENVRHFLADEPLTASYDGHSNCFIETGSHKAMLIDFNYEVEPSPGHYPSRVGLALMKESRLNHLGKRAFEWFYWHVLLPGRDVPGITSAMPLAGKRREASPGKREVGV